MVFRMLNRDQFLKEWKRLNKEVVLEMKNDKKRFNEIQSFDPHVKLEVRNFNHSEK